MLRTRAIKKIFKTTLMIFILIVAVSFYNVETVPVLKTDLEIEEINKLNISSIYLLNSDNYLVKSTTLIKDVSKKENINNIINSLKVNSNDLPNGLKGIIPEKTVVKEIIIGNDLITIDFSKELLNISLELEKQMIQSIVYSIIDCTNAKGVSILVEGESLLKYPISGEKLNPVLDKSIGINNSFNLTSRDNISKVVIYYLEDINNSLYYVPVTKYINDDREKIKIIVEELSSSYIYESNLMSFLNNNVELLNYNEENGVMILNFNDYLFDGNDKVLEEVIYSLAYSVFDNYDVSMVMFEVNSNNIKYVKLEDLD